MPVGTRTIFYQATPPAGWIRVTGIGATNLLRVITTNNVTDGGTGAGSDDPILNNKVATHTHPSDVFTTSSNAASHTHTVTLTSSAAGAHTHTFPIGGTVAGQFGVPAAVPQYVTPPAPVLDVSGVSAAHTHTVSGTSGATKPNHTHTVTVTTAANTGDNWEPRYLNVILCERTS